MRLLYIYDPTNEDKIYFFKHVSDNTWRLEYAGWS